jgi:hypothetical protein
MPGAEESGTAATGSANGGLLSAAANVKNDERRPGNACAALSNGEMTLQSLIWRRSVHEIGEHIRRDSLFDQLFLITLLPNAIGYIPTDKAYLLPVEKALTNRLEPGCAEPAIVHAIPLDGRRSTVAYFGKVSQ